MSFNPELPNNGTREKQICNYNTRIYSSTLRTKRLAARHQSKRRRANNVIKYVDAQARATATTTATTTTTTTTTSTNNEQESLGDNQ